MVGCVVVPCLPCAVSRGAVLPCSAVLLGSALFFALLLVVGFPSTLKSDCCFSLPLKIFLLYKKFRDFLLCGPALLCSAVRAVLCRLAVLVFCTVFCLLVVCSVVCVLCHSFPPCWQAQYHAVMLSNYLPLCDPASFSVSSGMLAFVIVAVATLLMCCSSVPPCVAGFLVCVLPVGRVPCCLCAVVSLPCLLQAQYHIVMLLNYLPMCDPTSFSVSAVATLLMCCSAVTPFGAGFLYCVLPVGRVLCGLCAVVFLLSLLASTMPHCDVI